MPRKYRCTLPLVRSRTHKGLCALLAVLWLAGGAVLAAPAAASTPAPCAGAALRPSAADLAAVETATLCLVNAVRTSRHLRVLRANGELARVAAWQVRQMVALDYFADVGPTGQTPLSLIAATRYSTSAVAFTVGQNLAWGTGLYTTPLHIVAAWMASPPHRAIILDGAFRDAGAAALASVPASLAQGLPGATYAMEFGVRR